MTILNRPEHFRQIDLRVIEPSPFCSLRTTIGRVAPHVGQLGRWTKTHGASVQVLTARPPPGVARLLASRRQLNPRA